MEVVFRVCLFLAGVIIILLGMLAFFSGEIPKNYGVDLSNPNYEILLRHQAVLLGLIGGLIIYAAGFKIYYELAAIIGLLSMLSFVILYYGVEGKINSQLNQVLRADLVGIGILLLGAFLYWI